MAVLFFQGEQGILFEDFDEFIRNGFYNLLHLGSLVTYKISRRVYIFCYSTFQIKYFMLIEKFSFFVEKGRYLIIKKLDVNTGKIVEVF